MATFRERAAHFVSPYVLFVMSICNFGVSHLGFKRSGSDYIVFFLLFNLVASFI